MLPREHDLLSYRSRFIEAVNEGLADTEAGRIYDAEQVFAELLSELGREKSRKARAGRARVSGVRNATSRRKS
jgi:hypothetical protein